MGDDIALPENYPVVYGPRGKGSHKLYPVTNGSKTVAHGPIGPYAGRMFYFSKRVNDGKGGWLCDASTSAVPCEWYNPFKGQRKPRPRVATVDRTGAIYAYDETVGF